MTFKLLMGLTVKSVTLPVASQLSDDIDQICFYQFTSRDAIRFYPEGRIELLFQLNSDFLHQPPATKNWILRPGGFVGGLHLHAYQVRSLEPGASCLGVSFRPGAAARYLPVKLHTLNNAVLSTGHIWGSRGARLTERVLNSSSLSNQIDMILTFLSNQRRSGQQDLSVLCTQIDRSCGKLTVDEMANMVNYSLVQLRRLFHREVGVAPKKFAQIVRVRKARTYLQEQFAQSLTDLAFSLGYYDQAHFVREFKSLTGLTPRQYS